jgi:drug/metabolite transporter (DMT)-like permease
MPHSTKTTQPAKTIGPMLAYVLLIICAVMWGSNITLGRAMHGDIPPIALAFWRNFFALIAVGLMARNHWSQIWPAMRPHLSLFLVGGVIGVGVFNALLYSAVHTTTAVNASLVMSLTPVLVPILAFFMLGQNFSMRQGIGVAVSFFGIGVMLTRADFSVLSRFDFRPGDLIMLGAVAAWSLYSVYVKKRPDAMHPLAFLTAMLCVAVLALAPAYLWESLTRGPMPLTVEAYGSAAYMGLFPTAFALTLFNRAVDSVGPSTAGHFQHLVPVFAALLGILFLGEVLQLYHGIGAVFIAAGIYCATSSANTK